jgi:CelD/BcsL family acetyltransferase involved in cellulose biosynthesis
MSPRGSRAAHRLDQVREIHTMGDPSADFRGFICDVARESAVIEAFADHLADDRAWDRLVLRDFLDPRLAGFLQRLRERDPGLEIAEHEGNACPLLALPDSWEDYLSECLTQPSRKSLKKRLRLAEEAGCRLTSIADSNAAEQLEHLLRLSAMRGRNEKDHLDRCRAIFESCIEHRCAEIFVLWLGKDGGQPAAAQGSFIDHHARSIGHYLTGYDEQFADLSPGRVMDAMCIRLAIERGWKAVDFLRGDEPYKHQLGARPRMTQHAFITRSGAMQKVRGAISGLRERLGR